MRTTTGKRLIGISLNIIFYCVVMTAIGYACLWCYQFTYLAFSNPISKVDWETCTTVEITVEENMSDKEIMAELERKGMVQDADAAYVRLYFSKYKEKLKPGKYIFYDNMHQDDIFVVIARDREVILENGLQGWSWDIE